MKKMILTALAALLMAAPAVQAQKVNKDALLSKITKSDADIVDAKKNAKAATWINRGKAFYDAAVAPTKDLFIGVEGTMLKLTPGVGEPQSVEQTKIGDQAVEAWVYPYFTVYFQDGKIIAWKQTDVILADAAQKAIEAYNKAFEVDPKSADKAKEGLKLVRDYCAQVGDVSHKTLDETAAADAYAMAFDAVASPAYNAPEPELLYFAGLLRTLDGQKSADSYAKGADLLTKAISLGYADEQGDIYYYLFHCYYGQKAADPSFVTKAKETLLTGVEKFPKNERIIEGLMQLYTSEEGVGDPANLVALIDQAIANNPENVDLWFGRGRIFYALLDYDEAIASFKKAAELKPDLYDGNYFVGLFYIIKGDDMNKAMNEKQYSSEAGYNADLKSVNDIYMAAVPWLEKAHAIKPDDANTIDYLKSVCFRLRDEEGMMDKYNTYNAIYKKMKGEE